MYVLNIEKLMVGDILLTSENIMISDDIKKNINIIKSPSLWIRLVTWSKYSHACEYAKLKVGTKYSIKEAIRTKIPFFKEKNRQFCSRLVAESYENVGVRLVENSSLCSPKELYKSEKIQIIPNCLRKATNNDFIIQKSFDIPDFFASFQSKIFEKIRSIVKSDIQNTYDLLRFLLQNPEFDEANTIAYR